MRHLENYNELTHLKCISRGAKTHLFGHRAMCPPNPNFNRPMQHYRVAAGTFVSFRSPYLVPKEQAATVNIATFAVTGAAVWRR